MTDYDQALANAVATRSSPPRIEMRKLSASQHIHDALWERIVSLELSPGKNLSRAELAEHYRVSQTPVRDAMMRLEEEGLMVVRPQSKTEVSKINVEHARETQFLRLALELEVVRKLTLANNPDALEPARRVLAQQETALTTGDMGLFVRLDRLFHFSLCEAAEAGNLWQLISSRSGHIDRLRTLNLPDPGKPNEILSYHRLILAAIESGSVQESEQAIRGHLSGTLASVDAIRAQNPHFF